jgi:hypothetical protein
MKTLFQNNMFYFKTNYIAVFGKLSSIYALVFNTLSGIPKS